MQTLPRLFRVSLTLNLWFLLLIPSVSAQSDAPFTLTADSLQNGKSVELSKLNWKYQPGDDPRFADPQFDDHSWETLKGTAITLAHLPQSGWRGIGWFRLWLQVDPMSQTLKRMNLRGLFMAMTIAKVSRNQLTISMAGMPPVWIYRAASGEVEEIALRAIPLGGMMNYQYKQQELAIGPGDVIVLMSDGLPERFNAENEMLDYGATKGALAAAAHRTPWEIIEHFVRVGDEWSNGRPQDDDVTFVALKVRDRQDGLADAPMGNSPGPCRGA